MKWQTVCASAAVAIGMSLAAGANSQAAAACTATGFYVDGINMTAAEINPGDVTGETIDATGCNVGIYYDDGTDGGPAGGTVSGATVENANYFGIVANGGGGSAPVTVNVSNSTITGIGEHPPNGDQHGNAIFYINGSTSASADDSRTCSTAAGASTNGAVSGNIVSGYQKNGITAKCPGVNVIVSGNTVTGAGEVDYIAQNGIELGQGATGSITGNSVTGNQYTGTNDADSSGILVFGGGPFGAVTTGAHVTNNTLTDNDVGIYAISCNADCSGPPTSPTVEIIQKNVISNPDVSNVSGCGSPQGYQAGISDLGRNDQISKNMISGAGYDTNDVACSGTGTTPTLFAIDTTGSNAKVHKSNIVSP